MADSPVGDGKRLTLPLPTARKDRVPSGSEGTSCQAFPPVRRDNVKQSIHPAVAAIIVIVVIVVAVMLGKKTLAPRDDGPDKPVDMSKMMGTQKIAPPPNAGKGAGVPTFGR